MPTHIDRLSVILDFVIRENLNSGNIGKAKVFNILKHKLPNFNSDGIRFVIDVLDKEVTRLVDARNFKNKEKVIFT